MAALAVGLASVRPHAPAWSQDRPYTIGYLSGTPDTQIPFHAVFYDTLQTLGYLDGRNLRLVKRFHEGKPERVSSMATELVALTPDVIVAVGPMDVDAVRSLTRTIPIVTVIAQDPLGRGLVQSLARPGGNITGLAATAGTQTGAKRLELLKEINPRLARVAVLREKGFSTARTSADLDRAALALGLTLDVVEMNGDGDLEPALAATMRNRPEALYLDGSALITRHRAPIAEFAIRHRLATCYVGRAHALAGVLVTYGFNIEENYRAAASYVDRILKGEKPADLPMQQPSKFEMVVNLRTARAIGVTIPQSILLRADELIE